MTYMQIYLESELDIDSLASELRNIFNCNHQNQSKWQIDQKRDGLNYGGLYYLFEIIGLELKLIKNVGEVLDSTFSEYEYYILCTELEKIDSTLFKECICYLGLLLKKNGIFNKVIEM